LGAGLAALGSLLVELVGSGVSSGVSSGVAGGGGVTASAGAGALGAWGVCASATTSGPFAPLSWAGRTAEPMNTPNASNAMTATPTIDGDGVAGWRRTCSEPAWSAGAADTSDAVTSSEGRSMPIHLAVAGASAPRRAPQSTQ
jgi:hypothetical protein